MTIVYWHEIESPIGRLLLVGDGTALQRLHFQRPGRSMSPDPAWRRDGARFATVCAQLQEYFNGARRVFAVSLALAGSEFQRAVWKALQAIPYGETVSYGELARRLGRPRASRAVGLANGANPVPIIVPCHRVIGADGSLTGFGGGLAVKRALLELEGVPGVEDFFSPTRR